MMRDIHNTLKKRYRLGALLVVSLLLSSGAFAQTPGLKDEVATDIKQLILNSKSILSGIQEGLSEGSTESDLSNTLLTVNDQTTFAEYLTLSIIKGKALSDNRYELRVAIKNSADQPVRLMNLDDAQNLILIDREGFASHLAVDAGSNNQQSAITIPAEAGLRVTWTFAEVEEKPASLRIYGLTFPIEK